MEQVKTFLDTSTIHGLSWISGTKKITRLFWIIVVIGGFTGAGYLIQLSFLNWSQSPITTTIETLPISEITFPNVTVCPPRNSFLDLNYDLMKSNESKVDEKTKEELFEYAKDVIQDSFYTKVLKNLHKLVYSDRYFNWYQGFTQLQYPFHNKNRLRYPVTTYATSGNISTQYFGQNFDAEKVDRKIYFELIVRPSESAEKKANITLMFAMKKNTIKEFSENDKMSFMNDDINPDITDFTKNFTNTVSVNPYYSAQSGGAGYTSSLSFKTFLVTLDRRLLNDYNINNTNLNLMPGFQFSWQYDMEVEPEAAFRADALNIEYGRFVNILHITKFGKEYTWKLVKDIRKFFLSKNINPECNSLETLLSIDLIRDNVMKVKEKLNLNEGLKMTTITTEQCMQYPCKTIKVDVPILYTDITKNTLHTAAEMFTYLNYCPPKLLLSAYDNVLKSTSPKKIVLGMISLRKVSQNNERECAEKIFMKMMRSFKLIEYQNIQMITRGYNDSTSLSMSAKKMVTYEELNTLGSSTIYKVTNHPVHIIGEDGLISQTSLIPFCEFGGSTSAMGVRVDQIDVPVCNSFKAKIYKDQLCYQVDPNKYKHRIDLKNELSLSLFIDFNEDRQFNEIDNEDHIITLNSIGLN